MAEQLANAPAQKAPEITDNPNTKLNNEPQENIPENTPQDLFLLYPNPASQEVSVSMAPFAADLSIKEVYLYNTEGKLCLQTQFKGSYCTIPLPNLYSGMYIVKVVTSEYEMNKKLIVQ